MHRHNREITLVGRDCIERKETTRIEHYQGSLPKFAQYLRTWGEAGTVKLGKQGKVIDRGVTMMFVGYANNHEGDCYRMYNPSTGKICETRDVIWLRRMFYERQDAEDTTQEPVVYLEREQDQEQSEDRESETGNESDSEDDNTYSDVWKKV